MPYVITVKGCNCDHPAQACGHCTLNPRARRAVATLEEAQHETEEAVTVAHEAETLASASGAYFKDAYSARMIPDSGGTVGPLPDGTVIEVARVEWVELAGRNFYGTHAEVLDAYNAREARA